MADAGLQSLFDSLEVGFGAALARDEDEAAADLAVTLRQSQSLREILVRSPARFHAPGITSASISLLGRDFVMSERRGLLARIDAVHFTIGTGTSRPRLSPETFIQFLRCRARERAPVRVETAAGRVLGRLMATPEDHLEIVGSFGRVLVPLSGVVAVRLCRGDSTDVS